MVVRRLLTTLMDVRIVWPAGVNRRLGMAVS